MAFKRVADFKPLHLIVAQSVMDPSEVKYFLSNAPADTPLSELLLVAFSRWHIERCFEDQKTELGFGHFEGRSYLGLKRHQAVTAVSHLFLAEVQPELRGEKSGVGGLPGADRGRCPGPFVVAGPYRGQNADRSRGETDRILPATQRHHPPQPHQDNTAKTPRAGHHINHVAPLPLECGLAL